LIFIYRYRWFLTASPNPLTAVQPPLPTQGQLPPYVLEVYKPFSRDHIVLSKYT